jgi:hypothetical protein
VVVGGGGRDHQEGERLGAGGREAFLFALLDMVCVDAIDGIQQLRVLRFGQPESQSIIGRAYLTLCAAMTSAC